MPQQAGRLSETAPDAAVQTGFRWQAPVRLDEPGFKALLASKARSVGSSVMDWSVLESLRPRREEAAAGCGTAMGRRKGITGFCRSMKDCRPCSASTPFR
jgi:hypothetical protein